MTVSKILSQKQFQKAIDQGVYMILDSMEADTATRMSMTGIKYYKVKYISPGLYTSQFFVAVN